MPAAKKPKHKLEYYRDTEAKWRWRFRAPNGNITCDCAEGYSRLSDAQKGFHSHAASIVSKNYVVVEIGKGKRLK